MTSMRTFEPLSTRNRYVMAMVLGTALTTLGSSTAADVADLPNPKALADIQRYCTACWRNARLDPECWSDCTQDVFCRLLERVSPQAWNRLLNPEGEERREFVRAIDTVKKRFQRQRKFSPTAVETLADRKEMNAGKRNERRESCVEAMQTLLTQRQQTIIGFALDGWAVHEIATQMEISEERVSDEKYKAIRKLRRHFQEIV